MSNCTCNSNGVLTDQLCPACQKRFDEERRLSESKQQEPQILTEDD